jgi:hypothetical protein
MKTESLLRSINRRLDELSGYFPGQSYEVQTPRAILEAVEGFGAIKAFPAGKPWKISRSKKVIEAVESNPQFKADLELAWKRIKELGTVKQMKSRIMQTRPSTTWTDEMIRNTARRNWELQGFDDTDLYGKTNDAIEEAIRTNDEQLANDLKRIMEMFHESTGIANSAGKLDKWVRITQAFQEAMDAHERRGLYSEIDEDEEE